MRLVVENLLPGTLESLVRFPFSRRQEGDGMLLFLPETGFRYPRLTSNFKSCLFPYTTMSSLQKAEDTQDVKHGGYSRKRAAPPAVMCVF